MPHTRNRFMLDYFNKLRSFWPIVGVLGLRQVGKTTFLRELVGIKNYQSFDDEEIREEAQASPKVFLSKLNPPAIVDEVQKVPELFDALKLKVDQKRIPGQWILTGSVSFNSLRGIRESLTGRIGLVHLYPMTLAEVNKLTFKAFPNVFHKDSMRLTIAQMANQLSLGGIPVPCFIREPSQRKLYFDSWLDTLIYRDAAKVYGRNYDGDICFNILKKIADILKVGEMPSTDAFKMDIRRLKKYLDTLQGLFLIRKIACHEQGVGRDIWLPTDSGVCHHLMGYAGGSGVNKVLAQIYLYNEVLSLHQYRGEKLRLQYFKSQHGTPIDLVWDNIPIKIVSENVVSTRIGHLEKPLLGAMKKLNSKRGILLAPIDQPHIQKEGISILPWSFWS